MKNKSDKKEIKYIRYRNYLLHFIILGLILVLLLVMSRVSIVFSNNYARNVYTRIVGGQIFLFGQVRLPWFNLLVLMFLLLIGFSIGRIVYTIVRYHAPVMRFKIYYRLKKTGLNYACLLLLAGIFYMSFQGILYNRLSFSVAHHLSVDITSDAALSDDALLLELQQTAKTAATLSEQVNRNGNNEFILCDETALAQNTQVAFMELQKKYPGIQSNLPKAKQDWTIGICNATGQSVCSNIITAEILYRSHSTDVTLPYRLCYETARFSGFIQADELAYIANAACEASGMVDFQYSAALVRFQSLSKEATRRNLDLSTVESLLPAQVSCDLQHIK